MSGRLDWDEVNRKSRAWRNELREAMKYVQSPDFSETAKKKRVAFYKRQIEILEADLKSVPACDIDRLEMRIRHCLKKIGLKNKNAHRT